MYGVTGSGDAVPRAGVGATTGAGGALGTVCAEAGWVRQAAKAKVQTVMDRLSRTRRMLIMGHMMAMASDSVIDMNQWQ